MVPDPFLLRFFPHGAEDPVIIYHEQIQQRLPRCGRVLDLGCGDHRELARYRDDTREVWGTDCERHPELQHSAWFRPMDTGGRIPFADDTFDVVAARWVLEHVDSPEFFLGEVGRVVRPGGAFVALTPHGRHYVTWATRLLAQLPHRVTQVLARRLYGRPLHDTFPTYFRLNTAFQLQAASRAAGLQLSQVQWFANPDYFRFWQPARRAAIVLDWLLDHGLAGLGRLYLVVSWIKPSEAAWRPLDVDRPTRSNAA
jgi:SAM-dependent methyltransferase